MILYCRLPLAAGAAEGMAPARGRDCHFLELLFRAPVELRWIITLQQTIITILPRQHPSDAIPTMFPTETKVCLSDAERSI